MNTYVVAFLGSNWYMLDLSNNENFKNRLEFHSRNTYITFQADELIRELIARQIKLIPSIIDLKSFDKQMSQEGKEFRDNDQWKVLSFLRYHKAIDHEFKLTEENIKLFLEIISKLYTQLLASNEEERERFENVELKVNDLIYNRQKNGVKINRILAEKMCMSLEKEIYSIKNKLQIEHNIFTPDNLETQKYYLNKKGYRIINSYLYTFKNHRKTDEVCNLFYELIRQTEDFEALIFILSHWGGKSRAYPSYYGFGTITSRITLRQPCLQNLRKTNRGVIEADEGMRLLYIDYSQFEAGILASLSDDKKLIELYNTDIYQDLAEQVLHDKSLRKEAKILFYRYMYGDDSLRKDAVNYFCGFKQLSKYKKEVENKLEKEGIIHGVKGNYRKKNKEVKTSWALSHVVQSTASYIYKMALLEVQKKIDNAEFLIPMHDGTVYQIKEPFYDQTKAEIEQIYKEVFKKNCKQIEPQLNCSDSFCE